MSIRIIFFGSTSDSVIVLEHLLHTSIVNSQLLICCIITQPPRPIGRKQALTPTPIETWAKEHSITVLSFPNHSEKSWEYLDKNQVVDTLSSLKPDLLISASYGQKIPTGILQKAQFGGLNVHPSLLPRWRGADPVPWAILTGDHQTGVSIVTIAEDFDNGRLIAQKKIPITEKDFADPLRTKLFDIGADVLIDILPEYIDTNGKKPSLSTPGQQSSDPYARKFTRDDGFLSWELLQAAIEGNDVSDHQLPKLFQEAKSFSSFDMWHLASGIERAWRALSPWPGIWTKINRRIKKSTNDAWEEKRVKILKLHVDNQKLVIDQVQLEGKTPVPFSQFATAYLWES